MKEAYIQFNIDEQVFALPITNLDRVVQVVEIAPLVDAPPFIMGLIDYHGEVMPVIDMRHLFQLPAKDLSLSDQLVICTLKGAKYALWVDETSELMEPEEGSIDAPENMLYGKKLLKGVLKTSDGLVMINDPDSFLNKEELLQVEQALSKLTKTSK